MKNKTKDELKQLIQDQFKFHFNSFTDAVIDAADLVVKIPMHHGVDSLNVGNAAAIAFWELRKH